METIVPFKGMHGPIFCKPNMQATTVNSAFIFQQCEQNYDFH